MPSFTPPAANAVDFTLASFTPPASTAVDFDLGVTPPVGPVLSAYAGTTNGSGVSTFTITSDDPLTTNGEVYRITLTAGSVTKRLYVRAT
jgi:hypothetical protein